MARTRTRWDGMRPISDWAKEMVEKWNHLERIAIMEEFNRIQREEHEARLSAREV